MESTYLLMHDLLMHEFKSPNLPLVEIGAKYLNMSKTEVERKARSKDLPFPAFRMGGQRSPWFVDIVEFAKYRVKISEEAKKVYEKFNAA